MLSSPHYAQSNGHAESAVKAMEALVIKVAPTGNIDIDKFQKALLEWRNTPRNHGLSPAQMVFGRPIRTQLPVHPHALRQCSPDEEQRQQKQQPTKDKRPPDATMTMRSLCRL